MYKIDCTAYLDLSNRDKLIAVQYIIQLQQDIPLDQLMISIEHITSAQILMLVAEVMLALGYSESEFYITKAKKLGFKYTPPESKPYIILPIKPIDKLIVCLRGLTLEHRVKYLPDNQNNALRYLTTYTRFLRSKQTYSPRNIEYMKYLLNECYEYGLYDGFLDTAQTRFTLIKRFGQQQENNYHHAMKDLQAALVFGVNGAIQTLCYSICQVPNITAQMYIQSFKHGFMTTEDWVKFPIGCVIPIAQIVSHIFGYKTISECVKYFMIQYAQFFATIYECVDEFWPQLNKLIYFDACQICGKETFVVSMDSHYWLCIDCAIDTFGEESDPEV